MSRTTKRKNPKRRKTTADLAADLVYWGESHPEGWLLAHNRVKHGIATRHGQYPANAARMIST